MTEIQISTSLMMNTGLTQLRSGAPFNSGNNICKNMIMHMATIVKAVFNLPQIPAATTIPSLATTSLSPVTINSLASIITTATGSIQRSKVKLISATMTSSLSASGSRNLPKFVTKFCSRAILPSSISVNDAIINTAIASIVCSLGPISKHSMNSINSGISTTLSTVSLLGRFIFFISYTSQSVLTPIRS